MHAWIAAALLVAQLSPDPVVTGADSPFVTRGGRLGVRGSDFPAKASIKVIVDGKWSGTVVRAAPDALVVELPQDVELGLHLLRLEFALEADRTVVRNVPGSPEREAIEIVSDALVAPKVAGTHPRVAYPLEVGGKAGSTFRVALFGEGFSPRASDNAIEIEGHGELTVCWKTDGKTCDDAETIAELISSRRIDLAQLPYDEVAGPQNVRVRVGTRASEWVPVAFSRIDEAGPLRWSILALVALVGVVTASLWSVRGRKVGDKTYRLLTVAFLDHESNTYSLSKLQFFVWTAAALFGYTYLSICRSLVQGHLAFADVPEGLPAIMLGSAATTTFAIGIASSRGPKGSGEVHPSFADFVTNGGVIAPERLQFFLWTIVGAVSFCILSAQHDPGTVDSLPTVPTGFLTLMGVSSLGYLGGKFARKPGPVIEQVLAKQGSLILEVRGRNLCLDANFRVGDDESRLIIQVDAKSTAPDSTPLLTLRPEELVRDSETGYAKAIRLEIVNPSDEWKKKPKQKLIIENPDGQQAVAWFEMPDAPRPAQAQP